MKLAARYRDISIRRKLMLIALLATVLAMLFAILALLVQQWFLQRDNLEKSVYAQASIVAANSTSALLLDDHQLAEKMLGSLSFIDNIEFAGLLDETGKDFALYVRPGVVMQPHHHARLDIKSHISTMTYLEIIIPVVAKQEQIGTIHVRSSMMPVYQELAWSVLMVFVAATGALLIAVILLRRLLPGVTDPLQHLVGLMTAVSRDKNYTLRAELTGKDELGALAEGFNGMLAQIQMRDDALAKHQQHLEQEIKQRTIRLTEAQRIARLGSWEWDIANNTLYWSDEIYRIFGLTPQQFGATYDAFLSAVHPADRHLVDASVQEALEHGQPYSIDHRILLADGSLRHVHEQAEVLHGGDGQGVRMQGTVQDITERKTAEQALRDANEQLSVLLDSLPIAVYRCQAEGDFAVMYMSHNVVSFTGYTPEDFIENTDLWIKHIHPDDAVRVAEEMAILFEKGKHAYEYRWLKADGSYLWIQDSLRLMRLEDGTPNYMVGMWQDITERKQVAEQMRKQQELTSQIIETIPMRVFWKDHELRYMGCNTLFAKDAGLSRPADMIGKSDYDMGWKDQAELYRADDRLVMDSGGPKLSYDEPQMTPDGGQIWLRTSKVPLHGKNNETIGMLGIYEDITKYKQMELSLRESEQRFRNIAELTTDWVWQVDENGIYVYSSEKVHDLLGYEPEEVCGKTPFDFMPPEEAARVAEVFKNIISNQKAFSYLENINLHKDGHRIILETSGVPLFSDEGIFHGYFGTERNITERKLAVQALEESELKFRTILDSAVDGILVVDGESHKFVTANNAICDMLGYRSEELYRLGMEDLHPAEALFDVRKQFESQLKGDVRMARNLPVKRKDGSIFFADVSASPMVLAGRLLMVGIFHNVTERKQAEERVNKLNEALESRVQERTKQLMTAQEELVRREKLAVLGQVAGSVGHELRNPLGVMNNAVYYLQTVLSDADETTREYLNIIKEEIAGAERIVSDLLDSVRTKPPHPEAVGVKELIEQTLRKITVPPSVAVKLDIPTTLSTLRVDAMQVHQVFRNLISNGVEAMPEGGTLQIGAVEDGQAGTVTVSVRDSGIGMTPEQLGHLFQPLFTTKARGIGLGLVVVKNLTEANSGSIEVQSEPGKGTIFTVTLPAAG